MEYIQCTHCGKKYRANDKVRAAIGRKIKCTACQETFPIVIQQYTKKTETTSTAAETEPVTAKKNMLQLYLAIALGICLLISLLLLFAANQETTPVSPQTAPVQLQATAETEAEVIPQHNPELENPACKKAAAAQWLIDVKVIHGVYSNKEYLELLDQGQLQSEQIRKNCEDPSIVHQILKAAKDNQQPAWLSDDIKRLEFQSLNLVFPD